jgi:hypothetical protein
MRFAQSGFYGAFANAPSNPRWLGSF